MKNQIKNASGISIFLLEELGDARLRCAQLKKYIDDAVGLIEKSSHRDHLFEVGAHLIHGVPDTLMKLEKALNASALAASKLDYEEIKDDLRPEKVDELERALDEVRIRRVQRRSKEESVMNVLEAAAQLNGFAAEIETEGSLDAKKLASFIGQLEVGIKEASESPDIAKVLRDLSAGLTEPSDDKPSRASLASILRRVLAHQIDESTFSKEAASGFKSINIRNRPHASGVSKKELIDAAYQAAENYYSCRAEARGVGAALQDAMEGYIARMGPLVGSPDSLVARAKDTKKMMYELDHLMGRAASSLEAFGRDLKKSDDSDRVDKKASDDDDEKEARFEEGVPADPTENMSPEEAKKWHEMNDKYEDKFKKSSVNEKFKVSRYEEGVPADPTENMSPEDAREWHKYNEMYGDKFKDEGIDKEAAWKTVEAASKLTKSTVQKLMAKHGIEGELTGSGSKWEVELDAKNKKKFEKHVTNETGGYKAGNGNWILSPDYKSKGDPNDPSSKHHYASADPWKV